MRGKIYALTLVTVCKFVVNEVVVETVVVLILNWRQTTNYWSGRIDQCPVLLKNAVLLSSVVHFTHFSKHNM